MKGYGMVDANVYWHGAPGEDQSSETYRDTLARTIQLVGRYALWTLDKSASELTEEQKSEA